VFYGHKTGIHIGEDDENKKRRRYTQSENEEDTRN
jgi:hypothetical protein